jgi:glycosyltransferase involved in cell wall biosynthesis
MNKNINKKAVGQKVAIVAELLVKMGGAERVVKKLAEMYPEAPIYTLLYDEEFCGKDFPRKRIIGSFLQKFPRFLRKRYRWFLGLMPYAIEKIDLSGFDLVISSSSAFAHGALTSSESVHICYCHSPMRYAWDYTHQYLQEKRFNWFTRWLATNALEKIRIWDKIAADRPDFYVANSDHVRKRVEKYFRLPADVIYPPVETKRFAVAKPGIEQKEMGEYFLIISTLAAYKRIDLAVSLFNKIGKKLVIIGDGAEADFLKTFAGENIVFPGRLSDNECAEWMAGCKAFIFPSEEDFGITMVEAQAAGKPVLAYAEGGAREIIKPGFNGEVFAVQTIESMEDGLGRLIVNYHHYDSQKIKAEAGKYSEENFEKQFRELVKQKCS